MVLSQNIYTIEKQTAAFGVGRLDCEGNVVRNIMSRCSVKIHFPNSP